MRTTEDWIRDPGACLRSFRKVHDLTLKETAAVVDVKSLSHLSDIEHGKSEPSVKLLRELIWWDARSTEFIKRRAKIRIERDAMGRE